MEYTVISEDFVGQFFPERERFTHKGDFGKVLALCGSRGFTGAAYLAAMGALRTGSGLVYLGVPQSIYEIEAVKLNEAIVFPLADADGKFSRLAGGKIAEAFRDMDALLFGCGVGQSEDMHELLVRTVLAYPGPLILDADGINLAAKHKDVLRDRTAPAILTPHAGEFERLTGEKPKNRVESAVKAAADLGAVILLKGKDTVITDGKTCYMNPTGNPGMAVGGSGDLLSGIILSLLGQGIPALEAAACGAWLHGMAGDIAARQFGEYGMLPTDMLQILPRLIGKVGFYEKSCGMDIGDSALFRM